LSAAPDKLSLAIIAATQADGAWAAELARQLDLPLLPTAADPVESIQVEIAVIVAGGRLQLQQTGPRAPGPIAVDFGSSSMRHRRRGGHNELLGRAVGVGKKFPLSVLDATAGLGRDSFVLADLGCHVLMCEREPLVAMMLGSALNVPSIDEDPWLSDVIKRLSLDSGDARQLAPDILQGVDVIYLDPMFPERDKSAAVKKEMALFQRLLHDGGTIEDAGDLLVWAVDQDVARVVVKRPPRAPLLAGREPSHQLRSKAVRYDVYALRAWE
jgi:16S rRNA (guanine1516-N2)-methyltransferase